MWYTKFGQSGDVVLSSRVRLARNLKKVPFGAKMTEKAEIKVIDECRKALPDLRYIDFSVMTDTEKQALAETHLVSPDMVQNRHKCGILTNNDCSLSIMLNEEDHIRIQVMRPGFDLRACLDVANQIDDKLEENLDIAFDEKLGYLTCCPTNLGTGLRASAMLHLPALTETGNMERLIRSLSKLGLTVRGIYGEGSKALGNIYQISNQITLGVTEDETLEKLDRIICDIVEKERSIGRELHTKNTFRLEDRLKRAYGTLTNARLLSSDETMSLVSDVRWGVNLGIIKNVNLETLSAVWYSTLPASITKAHNTQNATERDLKRAELFCEALKKERTENND
ncbi:MAG: protein arginine kinase [Ruminococcaceae bacterium]|nr:protein arginine kinase [Oscillospiraceae bacterium]